MQWLKNLFRKPEIKQKKKISFEEIENLLSMETDNIKSNVRTKLSKFRKNFIDNFILLIEDFDNLLNSEFEPIILEDKRDISNIVLTSRNNYCSSSKKILNNAIETLKNEESAEKVHNLILEVFKKLNGLSREAQILLISFQSQMKKISSDLRKIKNKLDRFESFLNTEYSIITLEREARRQIDLIREGRENNMRKKSEKKKIEEKIKELKSKVDAQKREIDKINKSEDAIKLNSLKREQLILENQIKSYIQNVENLVSEISRQIRKYVHTGDISKKDKSKVLEFLENPKMLLEEDSDIFKKVLEKTRKNIEKLETEDKKIKKFLITENKLLDQLNRFSQEYKKILKIREKNLRKISDLEKKINLEGQNKKLEEFNEQLEHLIESEKELEREIGYDEKREIEKLEQILSKIFDTEVKIKE